MQHGYREGKEEESSGKKKREREWRRIGC